MSNITHAHKRQSKRQAIITTDVLGVDFAVIDTAAHAETSALAAAREADLALIPCRPASLDLLAIGASVDVVKLVKVPAQVVFNGTPARGSLTDEARSAVEAYDIPCVPCSLGHRMAFVHALIDGLTVQESEPRGKASTEVRSLYEYLVNEMGV